MSEEQIPSVSPPPSQPVVKKRPSISKQVGIGIGIGCLIVILFGISIYALLIYDLEHQNQERKKAYESDMKCQQAVKDLSKAEQIYYIEHKTYTSDLDLLIKNSGGLPQPMHKGTDFYGVAIKSVDKNNYVIEYNRGYGHIYTCTKTGCWDNYSGH